MKIMLVTHVSTRWKSVERAISRAQKSLSRCLITFLTYASIPKYLFIKLVINVIEKIQNKLKDATQAWKVLKKYKDLDDNHICLRM